MAENDFLYQFRLILIGESTVGKSCILRRFKEGQFFDDTSQATVGVDFHAKLVKVNDQPIKLQLWDTAGQDRFRAIVKAYYRNAVGGLLVYDISSRDSFRRLNEWLDEARQHAAPHKPVFMLVGNKCDQAKSREVTTEDGQRYADEHGIEFVETSAKTGHNVEEVFHRLAGTIYDKIEDGEIRIQEGWEGVKRGELGAAGRKRTSPYRDNGAVKFPDNTNRETPKRGGCCN